MVFVYLSSSEIISCKKCGQQFDSESEQSPTQPTDEEESGPVDEDEDEVGPGEDTENEGGQDEGQDLPLPLFG